MRATFLIITVLSILFAKDSFGGLHFETIYDNKPATSLNLTHSNSISINQQFKIEFDFRMREKHPFGYMVALSDEQNHDFLVLSYIDFRDKEISYLDLSFMGRPGIISVPFSNDLIGRHSWHTVSVEFQLEEQNLKLDFQGESILVSNIEIPTLKDVDIYFGKVKSKVEPPSMDLKNIHIWTDREKIGHWPLNEFEGVTATNVDGDYVGKIIGGQWIATRHQYLSDILTIQGSGKYKNHFFIDEDDFHLYWFNHDTISKFNLQNFTLISSVKTEPVPDDYYIIYHDETNQLFLTDRGSDLPIYTYDWETKSWPDLDTTLTSLGQYYETELLYIPKINQFYSFGGYGWYTYKNDIRVYDLETKSWTTLEIDIPTDFYPQGFNGSFFDSKLNQIYLVGGSGTVSGKQEEGVQNFFQNWVFDLETRSLSKTFTFDEHTFRSKTQYSQMDQSFYTIILDDDDPNELNIFISNNDGSSQWVHPFNILGSVNQSFQSIFDFKLIEKTNELLFIVKNNNAEKVEYKFFTLSLPIVPIIENQENVTLSRTQSFLAILGLTLIIVLFRLKGSKTQPLIQNSIDPIFSKDNILDYGVTIQLFGGFKMWVNGKEIHKKDWQSKKARELFIFILLKNHNGVMPEEISLTFWPDVSKKSAINSRGVTLSRIRKVLGEHSSHLIRKNDYIYFSHGKTFQSDFHLVQVWINKKDFTQISNIINIFGHEGILPEMHQDWVESIKSNINQTVLSFMKSQSKTLIENSEWKILEKVGYFILGWDPLDDDGLKILIQSLKKNGKEGIAHHKYNEFINLYQAEMNEPYKIHYESL